MSELMPYEKLGMDKNIYSALKNSIYPGATDESIFLVWSYCKAATLDPMLKPVHIVTMQVTDKSQPKVNGYHPKENRDIVMPGIGLYRIQASRTGKYAGMTAPKFGPSITEEFTTEDFKKNEKKITVTYPEWCAMIVRKLLEDGTIVDFEVIEFWKENYASKSAYDPTPNAMWARRPFAQLAKCTEAQGLRKAFPELGAQPTAEEMEGKHMIEEAEELPKVNVADNLESKLNAKNEKQEVIEDKSKVETTIDMVMLTDKMCQSKSREDLQALMPEINGVKNFAEKKELMEVYKKKLTEFTE